MMNIVDYLDWQTGKGMKGEEGLKYFNDNQYVDKILRETLENYGVKF